MTLKVRTAAYLKHTGGLLIQIHSLIQVERLYESKQQRKKGVEKRVNGPLRSVLPVQPVQLLAVWHYKNIYGSPIQFVC